MKKKIKAHCIIITFINCHLYFILIQATFSKKIIIIFKNNVLGNFNNIL